MADVVTFDGVNRIITEIDTGGDNTLNVGEIYSEWKEWVKESDNSKYWMAFTALGGDPLTDTQNLGSTFFLENGWRIKPAERDHKLTIEGNLFTREVGESPYIPTTGGFTVAIETRTSNLVDTITVGSGVTSEDVANIAANSAAKTWGNVDSQSGSTFRDLLVGRATPADVIKALIGFGE